MSALADRETIDALRDAAALRAEEKLAQSMRALGHANEVRTHRRIVKERLASAEVRLSDVLIGVHPLLEGALALDLLRAIPGVGKGKALVWMRAARVSPLATVGRMTQRQRLELISFADGHQRTSSLWRRARAKASS